MTQAIAYIAHANSALKRFKDLTRQKLVLLEQLNGVNALCTYSHLYNVLHDIGCTINHPKYTEVLRDCVSNGYITRTTAGKNVLFGITVKGKQLLYSFCIELDRLVKANIAKYGNGFPE